MDNFDKVASLLSLEKIPFYIAWKDKNLAYLGANEKICQVANITIEDILGKTDYELPWKECADELKEQDMYVLQGNNIVNVIEFRLIAEQPQKILINKFPLRDNTGNITGILCISQDVSTEAYFENPVYRNMLYINSNLPKLIQEDESTLYSILKKITNDSLTNREIDCLSLWLNGYSVKQSSNFLGLSNKTVEAYRKHIKQKMGVVHKYQLVDFMYTKGILNTFLDAANFIRRKYKEGREYLIT